MMRHIGYRVAAALAMAAATFALACSEAGPTPARVWGEVSFDGKPVDDGKITLTPNGETPGGSVAGPIKEGRYDIPASEGPFVGGTYRVEVSMRRRPRRRSAPSRRDSSRPTPPACLACRTTST